MPGGDLHVIPISDPADPRLTPYLNQKDAWLRAAHNPDRRTDPSNHHSPLPPTGRFIAEGELVVESLVRSRFPTESILTTPAHLLSLAPRLARLPETVPIYTVAQPTMDAIAGFHIHRGVLACGLRSVPLEPLELIRAASILVIMENLSNHDNVGGIFRSVAALAGPGAAVLLTPGTCDPLYRKAIRVSMGHVLHVPFALLPEWPANWPTVIAAAGYTILSLTPDPAAIDLRACRPPPGHRPALLVGAEGPGLSAAALHAGLPVRIPMNPEVDSLNVTVAASIALHHFGGTARPG